MEILIADDDLTSRTLLENLACKWGFSPIAVEDGEEAWEVLKLKNPPKLLLIDWEMPKLNGLELCKRIRETATNDPAYIIILTARTDSNDIVEGLDSGANEYVTKPFNVAELQARINVGKRVLRLQEQLIQATEELSFQASHDALTNLLNRRAILDQMDIEIERAGRQKLPLCIAMADIDYFKKINDTHGHSAGDEVLKTVVERTIETLRAFDLMGRFGGEEFLFIINATQDEAQLLFERVRERIANTPFHHLDNSFNVTISCGFTVYDPSSDKRQLQALIDDADKALYAAKESGRNLVKYLNSDKKDLNI